jgi:AcrR family transcriptional regulator
MGRNYMPPAAKSVSNPPSQATVAGEQRRNTLILTAFSLIAEKGFEGLRVREVASRTGINIATLHYYFPTKEELVRAVVQYLIDQFSNEPPYPEPKGGDDPLALLRREFSDMQYRVQQLPQLLAVAAELELRSMRDPVIAAMLQEMYREWQAHIFEILQKGVDQGVFDPRLDIQATATVLMAVIKGYSYQPDNQTNAGVAELSRQLERWLTAGM